MTNFLLYQAHRKSRYGGAVTQRGSNPNLPRHSQLDTTTRGTPYIHTYTHTHVN